jgi:hypothetical protein
MTARSRHGGRADGSGRTSTRRANGRLSVVNDRRNSAERPVGRCEATLRLMARRSDRWKASWRSLLALALVIMLRGGAAAADPALAGWIENVRIGEPNGLQLTAKLDTGAESASLHAYDLRRYRREGRRRVSFTARNSQGETMHFDLPVVRIARIREHSGRPQERPVVRLGICLGRSFRVADVNLVDRTGFDYRLLIGRKFLSGSVVVDASRALLLAPDCRDGTVR